MIAEENFVHRVHSDPRAAVLIQDLKSLGGMPCAGCANPLTHHQALMSIVMGFKDAPRCTKCLASGLREDEAKLRGSLIRHIAQRSCYTEAWNWASREAGLPRIGTGNDLKMDLENHEQNAGGGATGGAFKAADSWDAGEQGCGELALELRLRMEGLCPGEILHLVARDLGVPEDLPAWCRLTGHQLVRAAHPEYWIKRKNDGRGESS